MFMEHKEMVDEIASILKAELSCAESLHATSSEAHTLLEEGKFDLLKERYRSRGEVLNLMVSLDRQLADLLTQARRVLTDDEWSSLIVLGEEVHRLMMSIMSLDRVNRNGIEDGCRDIAEKLKMLHQGNKMVHQYLRQDQTAANAGYQA
jgi:hypothetical protein